MPAFMNVNGSNIEQEWYLPPERDDAGEDQTISLEHQKSIEHEIGLVSREAKSVLQLLAQLTDCSRKCTSRGHFRLSRRNEALVQSELDSKHGADPWVC